MYGGRIVEDGPVLEVLRRPSHPYTKALVGATARITGDVDKARALPGRPPDLTTIATVGCVFRDRCAFAVDVCAESEPGLRDFPGGRRRACHVTAEAVLAAAAPAAVGGVAQ
jgi:oligopeptide/dipeptide ABC transporter ATP-binding protein